MENNPASTASPDNTVLVSLLNRSDNYLINNVFDVAQSAAWSSNGTSSIGGLSGNHYEVTDPGFIDAENLNFRIKKDAFVRGRGFDLSQVRISSGQSSQANMATLDSRKFKWQQPSCGAYEYYDSDEFLNPSGVRVPIGTQLLLLDDDQTYHSEVECVECSTNTLVDTKFFPSGGTYFFHLDYSCADPFTGSPEMEVWGCWGGGVNWNCWANKENASSLTLVSGTEGAGNRVVREKALIGTSTKSIGLFSWVGVQHACAAGVKIYRYQVREGNASGRLLQDYVPVRRGTQGMFFDRVHKKLILPSSGFLTPGSDVAAQSSQPV